MTIYKLEREQDAWKCINLLHKLHANVRWLVIQLRDTSRTLTTTELISSRDDWAVLYGKLNGLYTNHSTWFDSSWPDYSTSLSGSITSMQNINTIINNGLQTYYWDSDTNKPIVSEISQAHRNALADSIEAELE